MSTKSWYFLQETLRRKILQTGRICRKLQNLYCADNLFLQIPKGLFQLPPLPPNRITEKRTHLQEH